MASRIYTWLDSRLNLKPVQRTLLDEPIPGGASWIYVFGSATLFLTRKASPISWCCLDYSLPTKI